MFNSSDIDTALRLPSSSRPDEYFYHFVNQRLSLAKDSVGMIAVLVVQIREAIFPRVRYHGLGIDYNQLVSFVGQVEKRDQRVAIIKCFSEDIDVQRAFLNIVKMAMESAGDDVELFAQIESISQLFANLDGYSDKEATGLWGELFLICENGIEYLRGWCHASTKYDFKIADYYLEAKTTTGGQRAHHFALEQIRPINKESVYVASIMTELDPSGASIGELVEGALVLAGTDNSLRASILRNVTKSLGRGVGEKWDLRLSRERARSTLRYIAADAIPAVQLESSDLITRVKFIVDCSFVPSLTRPGGQSNKCVAVKSTTPR